MCLWGQKKPLSEKEIKDLGGLVVESTVFKKGFTGFVLFDPENRQYLYEYQAEKYFTPASNNKILTFFATESVLRDKMPLLFYQDLGDTLRFWGTGYPFLLNPEFEAYDTLQSWLQNREEQTWQFSNANYTDVRFGEGWSWDDYPYGYQVEKASFPLFGNAVRLIKDGHLDTLELNPPYFQERLIYKPSPTFGRLEDRNIFTFGANALKAEELDRKVAYIWSPRLLEELLQDTFKINVEIVTDTLPAIGQYQKLMAPIPDTIYRELLHDSDNYIAEQLLLMSSANRYGELNTSKILEYVNDTLLAYLPHPLKWVDGSGLSRYNKATPQDLIVILDQLYQRIPEDRLFDLFPAGGDSGTLKAWYNGPEGDPFIFAKTGTLRHVHCLSGYLRSKNGKVYIFSFMHNNFPDKLSELKEEMEKVFLWLYERL